MKDITRDAIETAAKLLEGVRIERERLASLADDEILVMGDRSTGYWSTFS